MQALIIDTESPKSSLKYEDLLPHTSGIEMASMKAVVGETGTLGKRVCDLVLLIFNSNHEFSVRYLRVLQRKMPGSKWFVLYHTPPEGKQTLEILRLGVKGLLPITTNTQELLQAIKLVGTFEATVINRNLFHDLLENCTSMAFRKKGLTPRENQVLLALAKGKTNQDLVDELNISMMTVKKHLHIIYEKLGVVSRTQAAIFVIHTTKKYW